MKKDKGHIDTLFTPSGCLSMHALSGLKQGQLGMLEKTRVQEHVDNCELCQDALEGISGMSADNLHKAVIQIKRKIIRRGLLRKYHKRNPILALKYVQVAASIIVLFFFGAGIYFLKNVEVEHKKMESDHILIGYIVDNEIEIIASSPLDEGPIIEKTKEVRPPSPFPLSPIQPKVDVHTKTSEDASIALLDDSGIAYEEPVLSYTVPEDKITNEEYVNLDIMPLFVGNKEKNFSTFVQQRTRYPAEAIEKGIEGRVFVHFVVSSKGKIENIEIARSVDPLLDNEAMRVIGLSPDWIPGKKNGLAVPVKMVFPVTFTIR
jgi:TonB family protein